MKRFLLSIFFLISTHVMIDAQTDPLLTRTYADPYVKGVPGVVPGTPGALNNTFGVNGGRDLTSIFGANTQAQAIRFYSSGKSLIAVNDPDHNQVKIGQFDGDGYLVAGFGTAGITTIAQQNVTGLYLDAQSRTIVIGADASGSWIARLVGTGSLDTSNFGGFHGSPAGMSIGELSVGFFAVGEQQAGRLITVGKDASLGGVVYAFRADGKVDQSFGITLPFRTPGALNPYGYRGKFVVADAGSHGIYDVAIDPTTDEIYVAYVDSSNRATVAKIVADGDNYDLNFGPLGTSAGAIAASVRISSVASESQVRVAIDQNGKIILAAVNTTNQYVIRRYNANGTVDTTFNGTGAALTLAGIATSYITHLIMTQANQMIVVGYDNSSSNNFIVFRVNANGTQDTAFSSTGIIPFNLNAPDVIRQARFGAIHPTGAIVAVGYERDLADAFPTDHSVAFNLYGDSFVPEYKQAPGATRAGTLDNTFRDGISPIVAVSSMVGLSALSGSIPKLMHVFYQTPSYLLIAQKGTSTYLTKLTADLTLDPTFHGGTLLNVITGTTSSQVNGFAFDKMSGDVDSHQSFFVVGNNLSVTGSLPWVKHYSSTGIADPRFALVPASSMTSGNVIEQQSFGRLIIAGSIGTTGGLAAHDIYGNVDTGFGSGTGKFSVTGSVAIYAMAVDAQDRIVVAYKDSLLAGSALSIVRIDESGSGLDSSFNVTDKILGVAADDQVRMALDQNQNIIVAVATATGYKVRRYSGASGTKDTGFNGTGELSFAFSGSAGTPKITQLMVESSGKILVLGFNALSGDSRVIQARLLSSGALDSGFNTGGMPQGNGLLEVDGGPAIDLEFYSEGIQLDRRLMLFGRNATTGDTLLARIFGDDLDYVTAIDREPVAGILGAADLSLQNSGNKNLTALVGASKVKVIRAIGAGKTLIATDNGLLTKLVRLTTESVLDATFNGGGISATTCPTGVTDMFVDSNGKILVVGTSSGITGLSWLRRYNANGSNDTAFGATGLVATNISAGYNVKAQQNGRILVTGIESGVGRIIAYTSNGILDTSFGNGTGKLSIGTTGIYHFAIDSDDKIYVAYDNGSHAVTLARYRSNGAGLDLDFGVNGIVTNALGAVVASADQIFVGLDQNQNVIVAGANATTLIVARYNSSGVLDNTFGTSGFAVVADSGIILKDLLIGRTGQVGTHSIIALVGYKNNADNLMFIAWIDETGALDINYNPTSVDEGIPGTVELEISETNVIRQLKSGVILADGRIVVAGYETTPGVSPVDVPVLMRRYSQRYAPQKAQAPIFGLPGTLDPSVQGTGIVLDFLEIGNQYGQAIFSLDNGFFIVGGYGTVPSDLTYNHFLLMKIGSDGVFDDSFGDSGITVTDLRTAANSETLTDVTIDYLGRIIAVGYADSGFALIRRYSASGILDTTFGDKTGNPARPTGTAAIAQMRFNAIGMQLNGRLIAIGQNFLTHTGVLVAFDLEGKLDPTFGDHGFVEVHDSTALHTMFIDADDSIVIAYKNGSGKANIARIQENGKPYNITQPGSTFGTDGTIIDVFGVNIADTHSVKIAVDAADKIIIAASIDGSNSIKIRRYNSNGTVDATFHVDGSALSIMTGSAQDRMIVQRLIANHAGQYIIAGYEHYALTGFNPFVAQVTNSGAVDTMFNSGGSQPSLNIFTVYENQSVDIAAISLTNNSANTISELIFYDTSSVQVGSTVDSFSSGANQAIPSTSVFAIMTDTYLGSGLTVPVSDLASSNVFSNSTIANNSGSTVGVTYYGTVNGVPNTALNSSEITVLTGQAIQIITGATNVTITALGTPVITNQTIVSNSNYIVSYNSGVWALTSAISLTNNYTTTATNLGFYNNLNALIGSLISSFASSSFVTIPTGAAYATMTDLSSTLTVPVSSSVSSAVFGLGSITNNSESTIGVLYYGTVNGISHTALNSSAISVLTGQAIPIISGATQVTITAGENVVISNQSIVANVNYNINLSGSTWSTTSAISLTNNYVTTATNLIFYNADGSQLASTVASFPAGASQAISSTSVYATMTDLSSTLTIPVSDSVSSNVFDVGEIINSSGLTFGVIYYGTVNGVPNVALNSPAFSVTSNQSVPVVAGATAVTITVSGSPVITNQSMRADSMYKVSYTGGVWALTVYTDQMISSAVVSPEGKIVTIGSIFGANRFQAFGATFFDTQYVDEVDRTPDFVAEGGFDANFGTAGHTTVYANGASTPVAGQKVRAACQLDSLKLMSIVSNRHQSWTVRVNTDGTTDDTYGSGLGILIDQRAGDEKVSQMRLDGNGHLMIVGTHSIFGGFLKRVRANGNMSLVFGGNAGDPAGTLYNIMSQVYAVAELTSGNTIVTGNNNGIGMAKMLLPTSGTDLTFATGGSYTNGVNIPSVAVDADDNMYVAVGYLDGITKNVRIVKMNSQGVLDAGFGTNGVVDNVISHIDDYTHTRIALDADGKIVVAASHGGTSGQVGVVRYNQDGTFDDQFNLGAQFDVSFSVPNTVHLTGLAVLENNKIVLSGYQDDGSVITNNDEWFVAQLQPSGIFDDEFNTSGQIPGLLTFQVSVSLEATRHSHDLTIQVDGKIVLCGSESPGTNLETPTIVRILDGGIPALPQFPGVISSLPVTTFPTFGDGGIAESNPILNLLEGGYLLVDSNGCTNIGGLTQNSQLVVARFTTSGSIDTTYNTTGSPQGVAVSPVINHLSNGGPVAIDSNNKMVVGGYTNDGTLAAVRFTASGVPDTTFSGDGLAQTGAIASLSNGGFVAVDSANRILVGGITSGHKLVVARFTAIGDADGGFGTSGIAKSGAIANLSQGGYLAVDAANNVYVGGYTTAGKLEVAKFNSAGVLISGFGTSGIAKTHAIDNLAGLGSIALDSQSRIVIGGYTSDQSLVAARFTTTGALDHSFSNNGIKKVKSITGLTIGGFITIDDLDRVIIGGFVTGSTGDNSMVAARLTSDGSVDSTVASGGVASTGTIAGLNQGGFTAVDNFDRILLGGLVATGDTAQLIAAKIYSGDEIFVTDPTNLSPVDFKIFRYGNNPDRFRHMILVDYLLGLISDPTVRDAVTTQINSILSDYIAQYDNVPGYNLVWSLFKKDLEFDNARLNLETAHPLATIVIENFFTRFNNRRTQLLRHS